MLQFNRRSGDASGVSFIVEYPFEALYEVEVLDRIQRNLEISKVVGYPGAYPVHAQQELNNGPILAVTPNEGEPWIGVFGGSNYASRALTWPGGRSLCVMHGLDAVVVRTDAPEEWYSVDWFTVQDAFAVPAFELVIFTTHAGVAAYGENGRLWETRFAWDDVEILGVEGDHLLLRGFDQPDRGHADFSVDLRSGVSRDDPYG